MATFAAAKVAVPSFCGLRQEMPAAAQRRVAAGSVAVHRSSPIVSASAEPLAAKAGKAMLGFAAGAALLAASGSAHAAVVKMGADTGDLKFVPDSLSVAAGETITFKNNAGFPHNVVFDEDAVPSGVNADSISHPDYLNAPGEEFSVTLDKPGTYEFYCEPHQGGGMKGVVTVS